MNLIATLMALTALVGLGVLWWWVRQLISALRVDSEHLDLLQAQITQLQRDLHTLAHRHEQVLEGRDPAVNEVPLSSEATPYQQAIELVRHGLPAQEVADRCGISRSEAELIVSLYRHSSPS